jgi:two-component sensor histidine kinase
LQFFSLKRFAARPSPLLQAGFVGLMSAAGGTALRGLLDMFAPGMAPYPLVFPAVLFATLFSGLRAGLIAGIVGIVAADFFFVEPRLTFQPSNLTHALSLLGTAFAVAMVLWFSSKYRNLLSSHVREREEIMASQLEMFEKSHGLMAVLEGPEFRLKYANPAYLRAVQKDKESVLGKPLSEVMPDVEPNFVLLEKVRQTGEAFTGRSLPVDHLIEGVRQTRYHDLALQPIWSAGGGSVGAIFLEAYEVTDKVEAEARLRFLMGEVDHRANNLLAVVQSIIKLTKADSVEALRRAQVGRINALARVHQVLAEARWRGADLDRLVREELQPYALGNEERVRIQGPSMPLGPAEAEALAIALHELATNAAKYGAFSTAAGRVDVVWTRGGQGGRHIRWQEGGGPPVVTPDRKGLGARVLERALAAVPGGRTQLSWRPEGLVCEFYLPPEAPQQPGDNEQMADLLEAS